MSSYCHLELLVNTVQSLISQITLQLICWCEESNLGAVDVVVISKHSRNEIDAQYNIWSQRILNANQHTTYDTSTANIKIYHENHHISSIKPVISTPWHVMSSWLGYELGQN
jgi:hypothetical protein